MGFYSKRVLPQVINFACKQKSASKQREKIVPFAEGNVLEIGIGSGLNLSFYDSNKVKQLTAIDPSMELWNIKSTKTETLGFDFSFQKAFADKIDLDSNSIDTIAVTYTLCSIPDLESSFEEFRRVLKPTEKLLFCEHGKAPDKKIEKWQNRINPIWKTFAGGCHLNKDIPKLIIKNGFKINDLDSMYIPGWKPASFNYWGSAGI